MKINLIITLALVLAMGCTDKKEESPKDTLTNGWPANGIAYEIFVQSFYDSDGDGIGDINGMTQKLDYLTDLNIDAIWLMPIMPSPSYHKYDVVDYKGIHPDYGTMDDFKNFVKEAHDREIKIIVDFVINHTSSKHPWFQNALKGEDNPYREYYVWADKDSIAEQIAKKEISFDSDNITQWHAPNGDTTTEHYYGFFYGGMPDLNFDSPKVRKEIYNIGEFWLTEVGVDGFRLDAAKHIYPDDRAEDNHTFWAEFKNKMTEIKPDVYLVGEVWANIETQAPYARGFSALFNFDLAFSILESVDKGKEVAAAIAGHGWQVNDRSMVKKIIAANEAYRSHNPEFHHAIFLSNHDQNRVASVLGGDISKIKLAASIYFTLPGTPFIYYGEEIGMPGKKPDELIREPFLWESQKSEGEPTWIDPQYAVRENIKSLEDQKKDKLSVYNHYKRMIELRKTNDALTKGEILISDIKQKGLLSFVRKSVEQDLLVLHNLTTTEIGLTGDDIMGYNSVILGNQVVDNKLTLPARSTTILMK